MNLMTVIRFSAHQPFVQQDYCVFTPSEGHQHTMQPGHVSVSSELKNLVLYT